MVSNFFWFFKSLGLVYIFFSSWKKEKNRITGLKYYIKKIDQNLNELLDPYDDKSPVGQCPR